MPGQHLLVIDDQRLDRAIATHAATRTGFDVTSTANIAETRALLKSGARFDFVILDLSLGSEDGLEVLPILHEFNPEAVVVFASGFDGRVLASSERLAATLGLPVAGVLRKPILPLALQRLLEQAPHTMTRDLSVATKITPDQVAKAIGDGEVQPWFQPKASLAIGSIVGAEALARWTRPDASVVPSSMFVPLVEQNGLAGMFTDAMLDLALKACARWRVQRPDCKLALNISPLLLDDARFTDRVDATLQRNRVPPGALILEITEGLGIPETPRAIEILTRLRIRGINLSVDDFGAGHSSLLSLVRMPFNEMKIDQAFVRESTSNRDSRKVVRAAASLGRELGLNVVAEGVETEAIAQLVRDAGCHVGQGWLYGEAVPADRFISALESAELEPVP